MILKNQIIPLLITAIFLNATHMASAMDHKENLEHTLLRDQSQQPTRKLKKCCRCTKVTAYVSGFILLPLTSFCIALKTKDIDEPLPSRLALATIATAASHATLATASIIAESIEEEIE